MMVCNITVHLRDGDKIETRWHNQGDAKIQFGAIQLGEITLLFDPSVIDSLLHALTVLDQEKTLKEDL